MISHIRNLSIFVANYRYLALAAPFGIFGGASAEFAFGREFRFWLAIFLIGLSIGGVGLYVFSVQASFIEARRLQGLEVRLSAELESLSEIKAKATEISSPKMLRAAAINQAMIEVSQLNFIRQDSAVAFYQTIQP